MQMNTVLKRGKISLMAFAVIGGVLAGGCSKSSEAPKPLAFEEAPQAIEAAFKDAKADVKKKADAAILALKDKKPDAALLLLQDLIALPGLTPKQRQTAASGMLSANLELQNAAAKGDSQAAAAVQYRRMNK